jgi:hypothetical protein
MQYFAIQQKVRAPILTKPARVPVCYNATKMSQLIGANINTKFGIVNTTMETTYLQVMLQSNIAVAVTAMTI